MRLVTQEEALAFIAGRLAGREHWILVCPADTSNRVAISIEEGYYDGHGEDFDMAWIFVPHLAAPVAVYAAKKSRLSPERLAAELSLPEATPEALRTRDVLAFTSLGQYAMEWLVGAVASASAPNN